jgi:hypothetical protein
MSDHDGVSQDGDSTFFKNAGNDLPECLGLVPEDSDFLSHCRENLKSGKYGSVSAAAGRRPVLRHSVKT